MSSNAPGGSFRPQLHALRGIAACAVLLFHWEQFFPAAGAVFGGFRLSDTIFDPSIYIGFGWLGVPLFFVLSGYLLGAQVVASKPTMGWLTTFYRRRFFRIYPAVWLQLIVLIAAAWWWLPALISEQAWATLPLQFALWLNLPPAMAAPLNGVWWTLPIELGFYIILPVIGLLTRAMGWRLVLLASVAITLNWRFAVMALNDVPNYLVVLPLLDMLPGTLLSFMLGYSLNFLPRSLTPRTRNTVWLLCLLGFLALLQWQLLRNDVYWTGHWILAVWVPAVATSIAGFVYLIDTSDRLQHCSNRTTLQWLGTISFGIYLWHFPVMRMLALTAPEAWGTPVMSVAALLITFAATLALAALSYRLVEKPLMAWGR